MYRSTSGSRSATTLASSHAYHLSVRAVLIAFCVLRTYNASVSAPCNIVREPQHLPPCPELRLLNLPFPLLHAFFLPSPSPVCFALYNTPTKGSGDPPTTFFEALDESKRDLVKNMSCLRKSSPVLNMYIPCSISSLGCVNNCRY